MKNKNKQLNIRVSEQALNKIKDNAQRLGMSQTEYFEMIALNGIIELVEIMNPDIHKRYEEIAKVLDKIGNNLNQIAKKLNSGGDIGTTSLNNIKIANEKFELIYKMVSAEKKRIIFKKSVA